MPAMMAQSVDNEQQLNPANYAKAVLNILEDSAAERTRLQDAQRAVVNIMEDSVGERARLEMTQKAVLNILEDSSTEKLHLEKIQKAVLNILDDLAGEVDERKRAEAQLLSANKELEGFSYSVSHDLRAPLRAIDGYSQMLEEDYADKLDEEGRRLFGVIRESSQKMAKLIDDLLAFSKLGRQAIGATTVDMNALVKEVIRELRAAGAGKSSQIVVADLPKVWGDRALLKQVWINLLLNAIKFSGKKDEPAIEVCGDIDGTEHVYSVKDNGAGFDMQYYNKLFGVFQRLHSTDEFQGTGVGLAIVQRVVTRHGGRVWAEGKLNHGATFFFALPQGEPNV